MRFKRTFAASLLVPFTILILWEISIKSGFIPHTLIAPPSKVAINFVRLFADGTLLTHSYISLYRLFVGFIIGSILGLLLGIFVGISKLFERLLAPTLQSIMPIPIIAWLPLLIVFFGIGEVLKLSIVGIAALLIVYINTVKGIRSTDSKLIELSDSLKKPKKELVGKILLPSAIPQIFTGMRVALGLSWILLIIAEFVASSKGLGWFIWDARNFSRPDDLIVGMITIGIFGKLSDVLIVRIENRLTNWRKSFEGK